MFKERIIDEFIANDFVPKEDKEKLLSLCANVSPWEVIAREGYCGSDDVLTVMGEYYGLPVFHIEDLRPDPTLSEKFTESTISKNKFIPVSLDNDVLTVAVCDPTDFMALSAIKAVHTGKLDFVLISEELMAKAITSLLSVKSTSEVLNDLNEKSTEQTNRENNVFEALNTPAVKFVDSLLNESISYNASDIHIEPFEKSVRVRYRIDGALHERAEFPIDYYPAICARLKILASINIAERRLPQDGHIDMLINDIRYDFRVSTFPTVYGEKLVIRILDKSAFGFTRAQLGFTEKENFYVDKILSHPYGIVLLTGPTGCGKTTTLYSFLKELNKEAVNIVTVEDPVEYTLPGINQTQVNPKADLTFANALRSILRQDPNIIMIGEIRDEETARIAIRAAITGHLVLSTLHTNDAPGSINRLIDMGIEPYLVADAVVGVISQRLVKKLCPKCKEKSLADRSEMNILGKREPVEIYRAKGCSYCNNTGYKGRTAVHEIMYLNDKMRFAINDRSYLEELKELAIKNGMVPLWKACRELVLNGTTSINELISLMSE